MKVQYILWGYLEGIGDLTDIEQPNVALTTLDTANVGAIEAAFECELFLSPTTLLSQELQSPAKLNSWVFQC
ncbi:unnamed protein product [marine sediment metagenome]|uniref:Uncharacterized protein n=1 Tax=marine sediment metagenome TaxID=412755 RepID=X1M1V9_9ZZZZ